MINSGCFGALTSRLLSVWSSARLADMSAAGMLEPGEYDTLRAAGSELGYDDTVRRALAS